MADLNKIGKEAFRDLERSLQPLRGRWPLPPLPPQRNLHLLQKQDRHHEHCTPSKEEKVLESDQVAKKYGGFLCVMFPERSNIA